MKDSIKKVRLSLAAVVAVGMFAAGCASTGTKDSGGMMTPAVSLSGAQEVPPASTAASGRSMIRIGADKSVSGTVTIGGMTATAAHIHEGAKGANGPVIVPLTKTSDTTFTVPAGAKLTDAQYNSFMAGNLYVNVHSAAFPGGEIRGQLSAK